MTNLENMGALAKSAARTLRIEDSSVKTEALELIASALLQNKADILTANALDVEAAKGSLSPSMIDRLSLSEERIESMADAVIAVSKWPDPVGQVLEERDLPNGLHVQKTSVPLGVCGIIFEARPNVTSDCAALCIKAGNACILRGGKEAFHSNMAITGVMRDALSSTALPADCIQLVEDTSRESAAEMMALTEYLDVLIPRGGAGLIRSVVDNAKVPVIETGVGNCHIYVDRAADISMALDIVFNAKTSRPSVCNAAEKLLVHKEIAAVFLPAMAEKLAEKDVELRADEAACRLLPHAKAASEGDWSREYLDYIMGVKIVNSIDDAIDHIERYSSHHSDCIVTSDQAAADRFLASVDSAAVYHNASTRFTDGGELGLGAEIGISTQKLHARGPMGVNQLVSYKYVISGSGQIR
ncbi:glutamate-5-semialdehyde dehydrogenase [Emergencia timonensis]|uniref:glutamate-5-semialdehyde dehydrogenase n=2 Tax=Emergencia timonensis TaxID=1776384 RepID=UPI000830F6DE|nr:glutamate-5-semialdehyde dehydrogenase [Emergencia timonensis]WNX87743.1 glutamate-5-semialdehyde dehydrogenase [Emergencia timonensis]